MHSKLFLAVGLFCIAAILIQQSFATCGTCERNGYACINKTSFHICYDNVINTNEIFSCAPDEICTNNARVCFPNNSENVKPACDVSKACGVCDGSKMFACTSRTTFVQCNGTNRTEVKSTCPVDKFCRTSGGEVCVDECKISLDGYECDSVDEVLN